MTDSAGVVPRVRIAAHPGETDVSRLCTLEARITNVEQQVRELLDLLHRMTQTAARERDLVRDRVRELELAHD